MGYAGGGFVYTAISSGLQIEKKLHGPGPREQGPALPAPSLSMIKEDISTYFNLENSKQFGMFGTGMKMSQNCPFPLTSK